MTHVRESYLFGIDIGIGSCGWAVISEKNGTKHIKALGSWCFDVPETHKERTPTNQIRRHNRLLRRVIRRRRNRMAEIRTLFAKYHLLNNHAPDAFRRTSLDPWEMRAQGLDRLLSPQEFATALGHIAKRRGFTSPAQRAKTLPPPNDSKMLTALATTQNLSTHYRTIGEMFARDPTYQLRRRNKNGLFDRTVSREALQYETKTLFKTQRLLGSTVASPTLEKAFTSIAFRQNPPQDSSPLVEACPFEPNEKRSSRFSPSFEYFRLLCRLVNLRITEGANERPLTQEELCTVCRDAGKTPLLTGKTIRTLISLRNTQHFTTIPREQEKKDITSRKGKSFTGTATFRAILGDTLWQQLKPRPELLDQTTWIISFHELTDTITEKLATIGLPSEAYMLICQAVQNDKFTAFKGASSLSDKAARKLIPYLQQGLTYDKACEKVGYNHAASKFSMHNTVNTKAKFKALMVDIRQSITNPIAKKAISEGMKQLWAMRNRWGVPKAIYIELARDVGHSLAQRQKLDKNIRAKTQQREQERMELCTLLNIQNISAETLLRYRLWKEQDGLCCYTNNPISLQDLTNKNNHVQIDHILPWSRFGDNSYNNKTLCFTKANQEKQNNTPYEWIHHIKGPEAWEAFVTFIENRTNMKGIKKRNFLLIANKETEQRFRNRNLTDTRYAARLIAEASCLFYPPGHRAEKNGTRHVFTRSGALTAALRHAWGIETLKKNDGKRLHDDRHHALDAVIVASASEQAIQKLTTLFQTHKRKGLPLSTSIIAPPWPTFHSELQRAYATILVARPERHRARGEGHAATIRQIRHEETGPVIYERKPIHALKLTDLTKIKDPERNAGLIASLRHWIEAGKPTDTPPRTPCATAHKGHEIRKVRLATAKKPAIAIRGGMADRGDMTRVDVFTLISRHGHTEWYIVPIYRHQIMSRNQWPSPPNRAIAANKPEEQWPIMDANAQFRFSLYPRSYVRLFKKDHVIEGYFAGSNRATASIALINPNNKLLRKGVGIKTLDHIQKYAVNRFGELAPIMQETRTWHGKALVPPLSSVKQP